ncbi:MAG: hypothetical protein KJ607_02060 [Bacteroidetes bacterium]|nr:hypothetical protein [Bacteroidota bacterium]
MKTLLSLLLLTGIFSSLIAQEIHVPITTLKIGNGRYNPDAKDGGYCILTNALNTHYFVDLKTMDTVYEYCARTNPPVFDFLPEKNLFTCLEDLDGNFSFIDMEFNFDTVTIIDTMPFFTEYFNRNHPGFHVHRNEFTLYLRPSLSFRYIVFGPFPLVIANNHPLKQALATKKLALNFYREATEEILSRKKIPGEHPSRDIRFLQTDKLIRGDTKNFFYSTRRIEDLWILNEKEILFLEADSMGYKIVRSSLFTAAELSSVLFSGEEPQQKIIFTSRNRQENFIIGEKRQFMAFSDEDTLVCIDLKTGSTYGRQKGIRPLFFVESDRFLAAENMSERKLVFLSIPELSPEEGMTADLSFSLIDTVQNPVMRKQFGELARSFSKAAGYGYDTARRLMFIADKKTVKVMSPEPLKYICTIGTTGYEDIRLIAGERILCWDRETNILDIWDVSDDALLRYPKPE